MVGTVAPGFAKNSRRIQQIDLSPQLWRGRRLRIDLTEMRDLTKRLISEELRLGSASDTESHAAFRVCEKLRHVLSTFAGVAGFRSLLARALVLAKADVPWLAKLKIKGDGSFENTAEIESHLVQAEAAKGGIALIDQLLSLLITFIGEELTLRLMHELWPKASVRNSKSKGNRT